MQHNIQTLIFDLGGVIINLKTEQQWIDENLLLNFHPEKLVEYQQNNFFQEFETGKIDLQYFLAALKNIANDNLISDNDLTNHWNAILLDIPKHRIDLLLELKKKYKLILLSNTNEIHLNKIYNYMQLQFGEDMLTPNFYHCYYSHEIGMRKPDKEIYEYVLQQENLIAENCLFLDDKAENLMEPQKLGIQTLQIDFNNLSKATLQHLL